MKIIFFSTKVLNRENVVFDHGPLYHHQSKVYFLRSISHSLFIISTNRDAIFDKLFAIIQKELELSRNNVFHRKIVFFGWVRKVYGPKDGIVFI